MVGEELDMLAFRVKVLLQVRVGFRRNNGGTMGDCVGIYLSNTRKNKYKHTEFLNLQNYLAVRVIVR